MSKRVSLQSTSTVVLLKKTIKAAPQGPEDDLDAENDDFVVAEDPVSVFSLLFTLLECYCHLFLYHL